MIKRRFTMQTILGLVFIAGALSGCINPGPVVVQTQQPDQLSILATTDALRTQVADSVYQGMTATALAQPPTETALPTETEIPTDIPTAIPLATFTTAPLVNTPPPTIPVSTATRVYIYPTITPTQGAYQCVVTKQSISYGMKIDAGVDFDARWTVKNIGTKNWASGAVDYAYVQGEEMQKGNSAFDLNTAVNTDKTVDIIVDMIAPKTPGSYRAIWRMAQDNVTMCFMQVDIVVQ